MMIRSKFWRTNIRMAPGFGKQREGYVALKWNGGDMIIFNVITDLTTIPVD